MTKLRTSAIALVLAATTAAGVTGCSKKEAPKAKDAWNQTQDRLGTYKSLKMSFAGTSEGKKTQMDVSGTVDGKTQDVTGSQGDAKFQMITVGGKSYIKANSAYFSQAGSSSQSEADRAMQKAMADKWVMMPAKSKDGSDSLMKGFISGMRDDSDEDSKKMLSDKATVTEDEVDGKDAWKITSEDKKLNVWVTSDDKYDILKASGFSGAKQKDASSATFSDANKNFDIKAPSGSKDITDLMKSAG